MSSISLIAVLFAATLAAPPLAAQPAAARPNDPPAVTDRGDGAEAWVLVAGLVGGTDGFRRLEARLAAEGHRVIVIAPYQLSVDSADVSFAALARRVERELDVRGVRTAHVVGHSHGGAVALRLAASAPERVASLTLLDVGALATSRGRVLSSSLRLVPIITRIPGGRRFVRERLLRGLRENSGTSDWLDEETQRRYTAPLLDHVDLAIGMALRVGRATEPEEVAAVVRRVRAPVTVVVGDAPHASGPSPEEIDGLAPLGALLDVVHLPGVGAFPHEEAPDEVACLLGTRVVRLAARRQDGAR